MESGSHSINTSIIWHTSAMTLQQEDNKISFSLKKIGNIDKDI